jgi:hypothetical protein
LNQSINLSRASSLRKYRFCCLFPKLANNHLLDKPLNKMGGYMMIRCL